MLARKALTAAVLVLALAPAQAVAGTRAVKGKGTGIASVNVRTLEISVVAKAKLTHVGKGWLVFRSQQTVVGPDGTRASGRFTFVAAGGDTMTGTFTLAGAPPTSTVHTSETAFTFTGGTGRFTGVTGLLRATNTLFPFEAPSETSPYLVETAESVVSGHLTF